MRKVNVTPVVNKKARATMQQRRVQQVAGLFLGIFLL